MQPLFDDSPKYDKHVVSIINQMLARLKNNHPKSESPVYARNARYIQEIHDGTFLNHNFVYSRSDQYDLNNVNDKVRACKGSWQRTRDIIIAALEHYELAKGKDRMPYNKKFLEDVSFATFFEGCNKFREDGCFDSNFMKFINEPKMSYDYNSAILIDKVKNEVMNLIEVPAEDFCKRYFKMKHQQLSFWYEMEDWTRWLRLFRKTFPNIYTEFISSCADGNPFLDFKKYLIASLRLKEGEKPVMNVYYFKLNRFGSERLDGMFKGWLRHGIDTKQFDVFRQLPRSIDCYYTDDSFVAAQPVVEKKVVNIEEIPIF